MKTSPESSFANVNMAAFQDSDTRSMGLHPSFDTTQPVEVRLGGWYRRGERLFDTKIDCRVSSTRLDIDLSKLEAWLEGIELPATLTRRAPSTVC